MGDGTCPSRCTSLREDGGARGEGCRCPPANGRCVPLQPVTLHAQCVSRRRNHRRVREGNHPPTGQCSRVQSVGPGSLTRTHLNSAARAEGSSKKAAVHAWVRCCSPTATASACSAAERPGGSWKPSGKSSRGSARVASSSCPSRLGRSTSPGEAVARRFGIVSRQCMGEQWAADATR